MIIGITGTLGAGKGTLVEYLKSKGFSHYSSSGILKKILSERNLPATRENLSALADELMQKFEGGVLQLSHERAQEKKDKNYILEAIHRIGESDYVRSIGGIVIGIDADIETRYKRVVGRKEGIKDQVTFEQFKADSKREDEGATGAGPNIRAVLSTADVILKNRNTLEDLYKQIDKVLEGFVR